MYREDCGDERPVFWLTCSLCGSRGGYSAGKYHEAYGAEDERIRGSRQERHASGMRALPFCLVNKRRIRRCMRTCLPRPGGDVDGTGKMRHALDGRVG